MIGAVADSPRRPMLSHYRPGVFAAGRCLRRAMARYHGPQSPYM